MAKEISRSYRIRQSKDFVLIALKTTVKDVEIENDSASIRFEPSYNNVANPRGSIRLSIKTDGEDQCIVETKIITDSILQKTKYVLPIIIGLCLVVSLMISFTFTSILSVIIIGSVIMFVCYLLDKLNEGVIENYLNDLIKKISSKHYSVPGLH